MLTDIIVCQGIFGKEPIFAENWKEPKQSLYLGLCNLKLWLWGVAVGQHPLPRGEQGGLGAVPPLT